MSHNEALTSPLCGQCAREGRVSIATYVFRPEEESLQGPLLGDPDCWPAAPAHGAALCEEHYRRLAPDASLDYVRRDGEPELAL